MENQASNQSTSLWPSGQSVRPSAPVCFVTCKVNVRGSSANWSDIFCGASLEKSSTSGKMEDVEPPARRWHIGNFLSHSSFKVRMGLLVIPRRVFPSLLDSLELRGTFEIELESRWVVDNQHPWANKPISVIVKSVPLRKKNGKTERATRHLVCDHVSKCARAILFYFIFEFGSSF